jgi:hypothetical protein
VQGPGTVDAVPLPVCCWNGGPAPDGEQPGLLVEQYGRAQPVIEPVDALPQTVLQLGNHMRRSIHEQINQ